MMKPESLHEHVCSLLAMMACIGSSGCSQGTPYESPGRFAVDSVYAEIRVPIDSLGMSSGSSCYFFMAYHYEVLGGVIESFCMTPVESPYGSCMDIDYFLSCYISPGSQMTESHEWRFDETYDGIDTTAVIVEIHGVMPDEHFHRCTMQGFDYVDTLRAPVKRGY